jgi:hypothetical protein
MATQEMQMSQIAAGSPAHRRTAVILAIAAALVVGAVIGRGTAPTSRTGSAVQAAPAFSFVGTSSADATRRAEVFDALGAIDTSITLVGTNSADAARRAEVYKALARLDQPASSTTPRLTDAERRALVYRLVAEAGNTP